MGIGVKIEKNNHYSNDLFCFFLSAAIFVVTFLLLGFNLSIALIVTFTVAVIIVNLLGLMYVWDISLNAVSLVNLVMVCCNSDSDFLFFALFQEVASKITMHSRSKKR